MMAKVDDRDVAVLGDGAEEPLHVLDEGDHPPPAAGIVDVLVLVGQRGARVDAADRRQELALAGMDDDGAAVAGPAQLDARHLRLDPEILPEAGGDVGRPARGLQRVAAEDPARPRHGRGRVVLARPLRLGGGAEQRHRDAVDRDRARRLAVMEDLVGADGARLVAPRLFLQPLDVDLPALLGDRHPLPPLRVAPPANAASTYHADPPPSRATGIG